MSHKAVHPSRDRHLMDADPTRVPMQPAEIKAIIAGLLMAMLLAALDQTIVATAMPTIARDLGDVEHLPWIVTAYLLAATASTPLYGKLADTHGRRPMLLISIATFLIGSVCCALAPTMLLLGLARGLQGIGGGGLISLAQTIIGDVVSPRERPRYQSMIASVFVLASLAGPLLGGFFAQHLHWSLIFWINLPIGLVALGMVHHLLRRLPRFERRRKLDIPGALLLVTATTSLLLALNWGGVRYAWTSKPIAALLAGSALAWTLFGWRLQTAAEPLIPLSVLRNNVVACSTLTASFAVSTFIGLAIYMPIFLQGVLGTSASDSGFAMLPLMLGTVTGAILSGSAMRRLAHYKRAPLVGLCLSLVICLLIAARPAAFGLVPVSLLLGLVSLGLGMVLSLATTVIQNSVPLHQLGTALATMNLCRQLAGALVVAVFGSIVIGQSVEGGASVDLVQLGPERLLPPFHLLFLLVAVGIVGAIAALVAMEERPLLGPASESAPALGE